MKLFIAIGLFGAAGAAARLVLGQVTFQLSYTGIFPWDTLVCNIIGCFLLGWLTAAIPSERQLLKVALGTGFIGSFTTFSAFSLEAVQLFDMQRWTVLIAYVITSYCGGLMMVWTGYSFGNRKTVNSAKAQERSS